MSFFVPLVSAINNKASALSMENPLIWYCDINELIVDTDNKESAWHVYWQTLNDAELKKVDEYLFPDDKKRALVSILLQKAAIRHRLGLHIDEGFTIERTKVRQYHYILHSALCNCRVGFILLCVSLLCCLIY